MIGIIVLTHGNLGHSLVETLCMLTHEDIPQTKAMSVDVTQAPEKAHATIAQAIKQLDSGDGVLILADMFGGTPSDMGFTFLEEGKIEVITGVNLPILFKAVDGRRKATLPELAEQLEKIGKTSICRASQVLKGNKTTA